MKTRVLLLVLSVCIILTGMAILRIETNQPPENLLKIAGKKLAEARIQNSPSFAPGTFREAAMYYNDAMAEWQAQNEKMILFRNYQRVSELAQKSAEKSNLAMVTSKETIVSTEKLLAQRIREAGQKIEDFEDHFGKFPMSKKHRDELAKSKLLYSESRFAFKNKNYQVCKPKLDAAELAINHMYSYYTDQLESYFKDYVLWNEMVRKTISETEKSRAYSIVVDKYNRKLLTFRNGKVYREYEVELGTNWIGDKMQQGDKSTPEGMYKIVEKKQNGQTKYHKALLLDYPNEADHQRFLHNKKNGIIGQGARIGNLIEIHGNGEKGVDWTDGCIAVSDAAMDELFKICTIGTRVTIVGSTKTLNELHISSK